MEVSMKSTKMVVAVALLVVAALLVAPAAARGATIDVIQPDDTIFVWEKDLDLSALSPGGAITSLKIVEDNNPVYSIPVPDYTEFDVPTYIPDSRLGQIYYAYNGTGAKGFAVTIDKPSLGLDIVLQDDHSASVNGKSISETSLLQFKIKAGVVGDVYQTTPAGTYATVSVKVSPEGGAQLTYFAEVDLADLDVTGATIYSGTLDLTEEDTGTYTAFAEWTSPSGFKDNAADSSTVSFTIRTEEVTIESDKDTVVRGNPFTVTISGDSQATYWLFVENENLDADEYPTIRDGQAGVTWWDPADEDIIPDYIDYADEDLTNDADGYVEDTLAIVLTNSAGTRKVQFDTTTDTDDTTFTIHVYSEFGDDDDSVKVKVEKGAITIVAEGDQSYFLGEEVTFSGTNTDSSDVFLFITGPNLASAGGYLSNPDEPVDEEDPDPWDDADNDAYASVDSNDEWELDWDTAELDLDAGTYTIYAVSEPANKDMLNEVEYDSVSIVIKKPFVTAGKTSDVVAIGDDLTITGTAEGDPDAVWIWVLGKNYYDLIRADVEDDGTFEEDIDTTAVASGQYFVVIQHPMYNGEFDVFEDDCITAPGDFCAVDGISLQDVFVLDGKGSLQGTDAAQALTEALDSPYIDDTYTKLDFLVEEPWITIDTIGAKYVGDVFTITGETNLAEGDELLVEVVSASFKPTEKTASGEFSGVSGTTDVVAGEDYNAWSFEVDAASFKPDEYIVRVESVDADYTATSTFDVLAGAPPTTAPATTAPPVTTAPATTAPPATAEPTPTPTPGFGALIALIGLGAVAVLVVRKH
jgi:PGF-CTERM protein